MKKEQKNLTLKSLTKSNVWDTQENDVIRYLKSAGKDSDIRENFRHYADILRSAFELEELKSYKEEDKARLAKRGFKVAEVVIDETTKYYWAIKKKSIMRVTDLSYENIRHITATKLLEVIERNFGGGWESLSQSIRDIIESGFDISTSTLPKANSHSGMYKRKVADGFEVLEIPKGNWVETIFAKAKPEVEKPRMRLENEERTEEEDYPDTKKEDDEFDNDDFNDENYRTAIEIQSSGGDNLEDGEAGEMIDNSSDY